MRGSRHGADKGDAGDGEGVEGFRTLAGEGRTTPGEGASNDGDRWVTVTWPAGEAAAVEEAAAWGVDPGQLHEAGGRVVVMLVHEALRRPPT